MRQHEELFTSLNQINMLTHEDVFREFEGCGFPHLYVRFPSAPLIIRSIDFPRNAQSFS